MDILQQDRVEAAEQRQELCDLITKLQQELQGADELRGKVRTWMMPFKSPDLTGLSTQSSILINFPLTGFAVAVSV